MSRFSPADRYDDAILAADPDDAPIEEWTIDEFDRFADLRHDGWSAGDDAFAG